MDFDLDGLLEDVPDDKAKAVGKPRAGARRAAQAEDEWGDLGLDDPAPVMKRAGTAMPRPAAGQREGGAKTSPAAAALR